MTDAEFPKHEVDATMLFLEKLGPGEAALFVCRLNRTVEAQLANNASFAKAYQEMLDDRAKLSAAVALTKDAKGALQAGVVYLKLKNMQDEISEAEYELLLELDKQVTACAAFLSGNQE